MVRRLGGLVVVVIAASVLAAAPAAGQETDTSGAGASAVRIQARLVASGKVEFGLQLDGDRTWLPRARLFPYATAEVGRWLFASPYTLGDGTVARIEARLVASGKVEFGLQLDGDRTWLPQERLFPYATAEVGRWLFASPYTLGDGVSTTAAVPQEASPDVPDDTEGVHKPAIDVLAGEGLFEGTLCGAGMFCPDEPVARSTVAVWLVRALGDDPAAVSASRFVDVEAEEWWARFVEGLAERLAELEDGRRLRGGPAALLPRRGGDARRACDTAGARLRPRGGPARPGTPTLRATPTRPISTRWRPPGSPPVARPPRCASAPTIVVTRGELATLLARALGLVPLGRGVQLVAAVALLPTSKGRPARRSHRWLPGVVGPSPGPGAVTRGDQRRRNASPSRGGSAQLRAQARRQAGTALRFCSRSHRGHVGQAGGGRSPNVGQDPHHLRRPRRLPRFTAPALCATGSTSNSAYGAERWMWTVNTVVHEWMHIRDFGTAPGTGYSLLVVRPDG